MFGAMNNLINYYSNVLGISEVITAAEPVVKKSTLFVSVKRSPRPSLQENNESAALFEKMLSAIGFQKDKIGFIEVSDVNAKDLENWTEQNSAVVVLDNPDHALNLNQSKVLWSFHPHELLLNVALKKIAWEHLKKLSKVGANV